MAGLVSLGYTPSYPRDTLNLKQLTNFANKQNPLSYPRCSTSRLGRTGVKFSGLVISDAKVTSTPRFGAFAGDVALGFATTHSM